MVTWTAQLGPQGTAAEERERIARADAACIGLVARLLEADTEGYTLAALQRWGAATAVDEALQVVALLGVGVWGLGVRGWGGYTPRFRGMFRGKHLLICS
jgi:hypothetical protein